MTEAAVNGIVAGDLDMKAAKLALSSSSTATRIAQLRTLEEKLSQNGIVVPRNLKTPAPRLILPSTNKCVFP